MSANVFGSRFQVMTFGESHGPGLGAVVDGCPAGVLWDQNLLDFNLTRRRPGAWDNNLDLVSARREADQVEVLSGVYEGRTLGTPIAMVIKNMDQRSSDYTEIKNQPRRGHADDVWKKKFEHVDPRGGGRSSGRETVSRVLAGSVAEMALRQLCPEMRMTVFVERIGPLSLGPDDLRKVHTDICSLSSTNEVNKYIDQHATRLPSSRLDSESQSLLRKAKEEGQSYGGNAAIWIDGFPAGLGQPVFHKLKADLASALMGVGATSAVEIGEGITSSSASGLSFHGIDDPNFGAEVYGGIRGGISTGERIFLRTHFKPTSSIAEVAKKGRHDPCIVIRAIPVIQAMVQLVTLDHLLWSRTDMI